MNIIYVNILHSGFGLTSKGATLESPSSAPVYPASAFAASSSATSAAATAPAPPPRTKKGKAPGPPPSIPSAAAQNAPFEVQLI